MKKEKIVPPKTKSVKAVIGVPKEMRPIRGIAPLHGHVHINFWPGIPATIRVNQGPELNLQDCGEYWQVII